MSKQKAIDGYVILILFLLPSGFLGLVSAKVFYIPGYFDLRLLSWLLSLPLLLVFWRNLAEIWETFSGKLLITVVLFILARFAISLLQGVPFKEAFTVFRMGFNSPISCLAFMCFFYSADNSRIERIIKWGFILFLLNLILYFLNYSGLSIYDNIKEINEETHQGITITRNLTGFPIYFPVFFVVSIYLILNRWSSLSVFAILFSLFTLYISATRNFIVANAIVFFVIMLFYVVRVNAGYFKRSVLVMLFGGFFLLTLFIFKADVYQFLQNKFASTVTVELKEDRGTYAYRKGLIETSISEISSTGESFFGKGYTRHGEKGSYRFVLGGDTFVAPVLFCEGWSGLLIRIAPIIYFLFWGLKRLKTYGTIQFVGIAFFALIISFAVNYVQTSAFYHFIEFLLFFYIAQRYLMNLDRNTEIE